MNILFVGGPGRSGTTAFMRYLNEHPEILICRERYKFVPEKVAPEYFTFERILDHQKDETNLSNKFHVDLLSRKDSEKLQWIGDKTPGYVRKLKTLHKNNPGARFIIMYRPIEEVAESYDARAKNRNDPHLQDKNGFEVGVREWNVAMRKTRWFIESGLNPHVLLVSYHDFFSGHESYTTLISHFLDLEFDNLVLQSWKAMSGKFQSKRREKETLTAAQKAYIERYKDNGSEEWILQRLKWQQEEPERILERQLEWSARPLRRFRANYSELSDDEDSGGFSRVRIPRLARASQKFHHIKNILFGKKR